jgi:hypothetical protein
MLLRYNIVTERDSRHACVRNAYLSKQPRDRKLERAQFAHTAGAEGTQVLTPQAGVGSSGRFEPRISRLLQTIRTHSILS